MVVWVKAAWERSVSTATRSAKAGLARTQPGIFSVDDLADVGTDDGTPVTDYGGSPKFTGTLNKVTIVTSK